MQHLSGASPAQPQAKKILPKGPAEWEETPVTSQKKSFLPVDVTDNNKSLSEVGKSEDQPLVLASQHPNSTSSISESSPAKPSQPSKAECPKENKDSAISQVSAKAASVLPTSVETVTSGKAKSPTVQKQEDMKLANESPNAQSAKAPSDFEKGNADLFTLQKCCPVCKEIFKKDPPNYNTCDSCKAIVCNLCVELNSRAEITEVRECPTKY